MFSFVPSFTPEKTAIYGVQRKGLAIKWFNGLKEAVKGIHGAKFWIDRGLCNPSQKFFTQDGIHLNAKAIRRCIEVTEDPFYLP